MTGQLYRIEWESNSTGLRGHGSPEDYASAQAKVEFLKAHGWARMAACRIVPAVAERKPDERQGMLALDY